MKNKRRNTLVKIVMSGVLFLSIFAITGCNDSTKKEETKEQETKEQETKDVTYELWQEGTGAFPDREVLDKQGMDYAVIVDTYQKVENDDWELGMKGLTIYTGDPMYNGIGIGAAYVRKTPPKKLVFKKWLIIPAKYEVIDGVEKICFNNTRRI